MRRHVNLQPLLSEVVSFLAARIASQISLTKGLRRAHLARFSIGLLLCGLVYALEQPGAVAFRWSGEAPPDLSGLEAKINRLGWTHTTSAILNREHILLFESSGHVSKTAVLRIVAITRSAAPGVERLPAHRSTSEIRILTGDIIVRFRPTVDVKSADQILARLGFTVRERSELPEPLRFLVRKEGIKVNIAVQLLSQRSEISSAVPNSIIVQTRKSLP